MILKRERKAAQINVSKNHFVGGAPILNLLLNLNVFRESYSQF